MGQFRVRYGERAFQQDASNAMKGDIVRGLIELITNSDDAYGEDASGKIRVEVEHRRNRPWKVVVRDRARGMRKSKMKEAIGGLGLRTSGFEHGENVRGNLGRGAKDLAAFGPVTFESICDGHYSKMVLEPDGSYDDPTERKATEELRKALGIPRGSGTMVMVEIGENFRCPQHGTLLDRLSKHYQLRDINSDPRRELTLVDLNTGASDGIRYGRPSLAEITSTEVSIDGYPDATVAITLYRNPERYENPASDAGRPEGILVKGRRAIYENTLFSYEGNPYAHWFSGTASCPFIDVLAADYDRRQADGVEQTPENPIPIIARNRDGLEHDHPFYKALSSAIENIFGEFVRAEEAAARRGEARESTRMRRTLDALGRDLGQLIDADLREIDEDGLGGGRRGSDEEAIRVIPQSPVLYMGEDKTISVVVLRSEGASEITVEPDPEGVVELLDGSAVPLSEHPRREDLLVARVRLRPLIEDEETYLTIRCMDHEVLALVEVRPERENPDPTPPEDFQFERERYQMTVGKRRKLVVLAPVEVVDVHGADCLTVSSEPEVAVMSGGRTRLEFDEELLCYVGRVEIDPRSLGARATLSASLGTKRASCEVVVAQHDDRGPNLEIKIVDEAGGKYRALVDRVGDRVKIKIQGGHSAIRRYLGPGPDFPHQDTAAARLVIAEIVAGEACRMVMEKKYATTGELDAPAFYSEHLTYMQKYLVRCHRLLVGDAELQ